VARSVYIAQIICSAAMVEKINNKHGFTLEDVRAAVQWPARPARTYWIGLDDDPKGPRLVAVGVVPDGRAVKVVLYPVEGPFEGTWRLGTAVLQT
jgi:hypothetical protein